jgi:hypothetical protein
MKREMIATLIGIIFGAALVFIDNDPAPMVIPTKVIRIKDSVKTRYFLIGYAISDQQRGNIEWVANSGKLPSKIQLLTELHNVKNVAPFRDSDFVILGIYEFKNEAEMNQLDNK